MSDETQPSNADRFRKMAERIDNNREDGFGGACVIMPPAGGGDPIEILIVVPPGGFSDLVQFYSMVSSRIQRSLDEVNATVAMQQGFGRR